METFRTPDHNLSATYMTQTEANEVMELWAIRQREEAARQSLITVHDIAEATQLSSQEVERLLHEVRNSRGSVGRQSVSIANAEPVQTNRQLNPTLWASWRRVAPLTIPIAILMALYLGGGPDRFGEHRRNLTDTLLFYAAGMAMWQLFKAVKLKVNPAFFRSLSDSTAGTKMRD